MHARINESRDSRPSLTVMSLPQAQGDVTPLGFSLSMTASPLAPSGGSIGFHLGYPFPPSAYNPGRSVRHGADPFSAKWWVCISEWMCGTEDSLLEFRRGTGEKVQKGSLAVGKVVGSGKTTLSLHCLHPYSCPTPAISFGAWPPPAYLPLPHLPLFITPGLTLSKVNHHPSPSPWPWTVPFLTEALYSPDVRAEFCPLPRPPLSCSSPKPECGGGGDADELPKFTALTDHLLNFYCLIIFLKSIYF